MPAWQFLHHLKRRVTCPVLTVVGEHGVNLTVLAEMLFILVGFCCCLTASPPNEPVETDVRIGFSSISDHVPRVPINLLLLVPLFSEKGGGWTRLDLTQSSMVTPSSRWIKKVSWIVSVKVKCESLEVVTNKPNPLNVYSLFTEVRSKLINIGLFCLALKLTHPPHIFSSYVHEQVGIMRLSNYQVHLYTDSNHFWLQGVFYTSAFFRRRFVTWPVPCRHRSLVSRPVTAAPGTSPSSNSSRQMGHRPAAAGTEGKSSTALPKASGSCADPPRSFLGRSAVCARSASSWSRWSSFLRM